VISWRRFAPFLGVGGLLVIVLAYRRLATPVVGAVAEAWYQKVERRFVSDRDQLVPPQGARWFGMYRPELPWNYTRFSQIGTELGIRPRIVSWYQSWGVGDASEFKDEAISKAIAAGLIPLVTWEPWMSSFGPLSVPNPEGSVAYINQGRFDAYIREWARAAVRVGGPMFLRPFHEMGNPWYQWSTSYGNSPGSLADAWRHVVRVFREEGAKNVAFVWTPYTKEDNAAWPGDEWVDWIGLDVFNYGALTTQGEWTGFGDIMKEQLGHLPPTDKPIMISEIGCSGVGGDRTEWWTEALRSLKAGQQPRVKAVVVFDNPAHQMANTSEPVDWGFTHSPDLLPLLHPLAVQAGLFPEGPSITKD